MNPGQVPTTIDNLVPTSCQLSLLPDSVPCRYVSVGEASRLGKSAPSSGIRICFVDQRPCRGWRDQGISSTHVTAGPSTQRGWNTQQVQPSSEPPPRLELQRCPVVFVVLGMKAWKPAIFNSPSVGTQVSRWNRVRPWHGQPDLPPDYCVDKVQTDFWGAQLQPLVRKKTASDIAPTHLPPAGPSRYFRGPPAREYMEGHSDGMPAVLIDGALRTGALRGTALQVPRSLFFGLLGRCT